MKKLELIKLKKALSCLALSSMVGVCSYIGLKDYQKRQEDNIRLMITKIIMEQDMKKMDSDEVSEIDYFLNNIINSNNDDLSESSIDNSWHKVYDEFSEKAYYVNNGISVTITEYDEKAGHIVETIIRPCEQKIINGETYYFAPEGYVLHGYVCEKKRILK